MNFHDHGKSPVCINRNDRFVIARDEYETFVIRLVTIRDGSTICVSTLVP